MVNADIILILLVLTHLRLLGASRLGASIRTVAVQGILLGALALLAHHDHWTAAVLVVALGGMAVKGVVFPWLLFRALREAEVEREVEPFVGPILSLLAGVAGLGAALWLARRLPLPEPPHSSLLVAVALFSILVGLFLIITRKKAISQVLGFLVMENGIYAFGVGLVLESPLLVELGVLLDVFVAVLVMGIIIFHISREFDHIDTHELTSLRD
jgi:hydrogenase-4 component E